MGNETVIYGNEHEIPLDERSGLGVHLILGAPHPAAAVDPNDNGEVRTGWRPVDIEQLPFVSRFGVGDVSFHHGHWLGRRHREDDRQRADKREKPGHAINPFDAIMISKSTLL
jgi:hypothetical protein